MWRYFLSAFLVLEGCTPSQQLLNYTAATLPSIPPEKLPSLVVMTTDYDVAESKFRPAKEELFVQVRDSMLTDLVSEWMSRSTSTVKREAASESHYSDSAIQALLDRYQADDLILLRKLDIRFIQTGVDVEKTESGKSRTAHYDIESEAVYGWYNRQGLVKEYPVRVARHHSDRSVISGLLAAGPGIVSNKRDAFEMGSANVHRFVDQFLPGIAKRSRLVFTKDAFAPVGAALSRSDFEAAMVESLRLTESPDAGIASRAFYNCAVLAERKNQPAEARAFLQKALEKAPLMEARYMILDFPEWN